MVEFLKLSEDQRRGIIGVIDYTQGIPEKAVEKDWWVTLTLKALFSSEYAQYMVFKGGTSLSKCWKLIERFSEDIDIALNSEAFGVKYELNPGKNYVTNLKKKACSFTSNELKNCLVKQLLSFGVPAELFTVEAAAVEAKMPDKDPQVLYLKYKSLYEASDYLADQVKIEISARSQHEPASKIKVNSFIGESAHVSKDAYKEEPVELIAVEPQRTFLEKAFLLHEEFKKPDKTKIKAERMSRHLYDLERMMDREIGKIALEDEQLYKSIIKHREKYSRLGWVDYTMLHRDSISFVPPDDLMTMYESDYKSMREEMIYGEAPEFSGLVKRIKKLNNRFRTVPPTLKKVTIASEFPPYHFFKDEEKIKNNTWRIDIDEKFRIFNLHSFTLHPIELRNDFEILIRIENDEDTSIKLNAANWDYIERHKNTLFFKHDGDYEINLDLPEGRKWITITVYELKPIEEYHIKLTCNYR